MATHHPSVRTARVLSIDELHRQATAARQLSLSAMTNSPSRYMPPPLPSDPIERTKVKAELVAEANKLPRLPLLRRECVYQTDNYRRLVHARRIALHREEALRIAERALGPDDDRLLAARGVVDKKEQEREERQKLWLRIMAAVGFAQVQEQAAQLDAMAKLRRLLSPVVRRARERIRLRRRNQLVLAICERDMQRPTLQAVKTSSPLVSWWTENSLTALQAALTPGVALGDMLVVPPGGVPDAGFFMIDNGSVHVVINRDKTMPAPENIALITAERQRMMFPLNKQFGLVAPDAVKVDAKGDRGYAFGDFAYCLDEPCHVGYRAASGRFLYWHCPHDKFDELLQREAIRNPVAAKKAKRQIRADMLPKLHPPTYLSMQNCGLNGVISQFAEHDADALRALLTPMCVEKGHVFWNDGDDPAFFFFVANGSVAVQTTAAKRVVTHTQDGVTATSLRLTDDGSDDDLARFLNATTSSATASATGGYATLLTKRPWSAVGFEGAVALDKRSTRVVALELTDVWVCEARKLLDLLLSRAGIFLRVLEDVERVKTERMNRATLIDALALEPLFKDIQRPTLDLIAATAVPRWLRCHDSIRPTHGPASSALFYVTRGICMIKAAVFDHPNDGDDDKPTLRSAQTYTGDMHHIGRQFHAPAAINVPQGLIPNCNACFPLQASLIVGSTPLEVWELRAPLVLDALARVASPSKTAGRSTSPSSAVSSRPTTRESSKQPPSPRKAPVPPSSPAATTGLGSSVRARAMLSSLPALVLDRAHAAIAERRDDIVELASVEKSFESIRCALEAEAVAAMAQSRMSRH